MSFAFDKLLICFGVILLFTLFAGSHAGLAYDVAYPDRLVVSRTYLAHFAPCPSLPVCQVGELHSAPDVIHDMAKRRFLPTRRDLRHYANGDESSESNEDDAHLNAKRYFLKSKRYFLNSK